MSSCGAWLPQLCQCGLKQRRPRLEVLRKHERSRLSAQLCAFTDEAQRNEDPNGVSGPTPFAGPYAKACQLSQHALILVLKASSNLIACETLPRLAIEIIHGGPFFRGLVISNVYFRSYFRHAFVALPDCEPQSSEAPKPQQSLFGTW